MSQSQPLFPTFEAICDDSEHVLAWWDYSLDAAAWFKQSHVKSEHAAALLCRQNPRGKGFDPTSTTTDETTPEDYERLRDLFDSPVYADGAKDLRFWLDVAQKNGAKHHSWIDEYRTASVASVTDSLQSDETTSLNNQDQQDISLNSTEKRLTGWKADALEQWPKILQLYKGKPDASDVAKFLLNIGTLNKVPGQRDKFTWVPANTPDRREKVLALKTIQNAMPEFYKIGAARKNPD